MSSRQNGPNASRPVPGAARLAVVLGLGLMVTAAACSRSGGPVANPAAPSAAEAPPSVDHASGPQHRHFTASVSPGSVPANQTGVTLSFTVTTCADATPGCTDGESDHPLGQVEIVVPAALTVTGVGNFGGAQAWATTWVSGQTVMVGAPTGPTRLTAGQSATFDVTVDTPLVCDAYAFQTPRGGQNTLTDTIDFNFDFYGGALSVEVTGCDAEECPAAPSIAAHYLKGLGIHPGSSEYQNIVSQVADHMNDDPGPDFDGIDPCDEEAYAAAVQAFVDGILSTLGLP